MYFGDDDPRRLRLTVDEKTAHRLSRRIRRSAQQPRPKLDRIREAIDAGLYENPLKLSVAMDRLLERLDR